MWGALHAELDMREPTRVWSPVTSCPVTIVVWMVEAKTQ